MLRGMVRPAAAVVAALGFQSWAATASAVTPTQQVINMMTEIHAKGEKMKEEEQKVYATYAEWVDDESKRLGFEIIDHNRRIEDLIAYISKAESDVKAAADHIADLNAQIEKLTGDKAAATSIREEQHAEYLKISQDYSESVSALRHAIQVLESQSYDRSQAEMLLQRMSTTVPGMPRVLAAFLQEKGRTSLRGDGAPAVAAYEFQSGGIVAMLEGLHTKFRTELADVESAETEQAHQFGLTELHLTNVITKDTSDRDEKVVFKGKRSADAARGKGELEETRAALASDEQLKSEIETTFKSKTATYEENQKVRADELVAVSKAIEIISSPAVSGSYAKHINFVQLASSSKPATFLQLGRSRHRISARQQAASLLAKKGRALGSKELLALAEAAAGNPFEKVIGMIEDLITRLKEAAAAEAEHKAWCDEQLHANKHKRDKKTAQVDKLVAEIQAMEASIADMAATIQTLVEEQAELTKNMKEATEFRTVEKAENLATIADSKAGFNAVGKALVILKEYYSAQTSLLQQVPEMAAYKGQQDGKTGVIGMLEVVQTDFSRLRSQTEAAESEAAAEYANFMKVSEASKLQKHNEEVQLRLDKDQTEYENGETKKDLDATQKELDRANKYFKYLEPNCLQVHVNWDDRVAHRQEEIAALKEAYGILDQKTVE